MRIKNETNFATGLLFTLIGLSVACVAFTYQMGTAARMGPGYFPFWLGVLLAGLGVSLVFGSLGSSSADEKLDHSSPKSLAIILAAVLLFGVLIDVLGLALAVFVLAILSSAASHEFSKKTTMITALVLMIGCSGIFIYGLELPIRQWPSFIGR